MFCSYCELISFQFRFFLAVPRRFRRMALFAAILLLVSGPAQAAQTAVSQGRQAVPARDIQVKDVKAVAWKALWDQGRDLARQGRIAEAAPVYEALLGMREGLETARWELVNILLSLKKDEAAIPHLELLLEAAPGNFEYVVALAEASRRQGNMARAAELYEKARKREPGNLKVLRGEASALLALQRRSEAAPLLEALLARDRGNQALREELANLYFDLGAPEKALAQTAALIRENRAEPALIFRAAQAAERLGQESQAHEYWQRLTRTAYGQEAKERLTSYYLKAGQGEEALAYLTPLLEKEPSSPRLLKRLGQISASLARYPEALGLFARYLSLKPEDREALRRLIEVRAALSGRPEADGYWANLPRGIAPDLAALAREAGLYEARGELPEALALYDLLLAAAPEEGRILARKARILLAAGETRAVDSLWADLARRRKLVEVLELLLDLEPGNKAALGKLADIYLAEGELGKSLGMFSRLAELGMRTPAVLGGMAMIEERLGNPGRALALYEELAGLAGEEGAVALHALELAGELGLAGKVHGHLARLRRDFPILANRPENRLLIAKALAGAYSLAQAVGQYQALLDDPQAGADLRATASQGLAAAYRQSGLDYEAEQALRQAYLIKPGVAGLDVAALPRSKAAALLLKAEAGQDQGRMLAYCRSLAEEGLHRVLLDAARAAGERYPESAAFRVLQAQALEAGGEAAGAIAVWQELLRDFPAQDFAATRLAALLLNQGRFAELGELWQAFPEVAARPDMLLLSARVLWAGREWDKALAVYDGFLSPSVAEKVSAHGAGLGLSLPAELKPDVWTRLTVPEVERRTGLDALMEQAAFLAAGPGPESLNRATAPFYAAWRWEKRFALEREARQALLQREYLAAANYLRKLLADYPADVSLQFDLAGIYSRFGQLGSEAVLYEEIMAAGGDFPALTEARARNELKRRPKGTAGYGYLREEGRDGYKAISKTWEEASFQYSPLLQHDLGVSLSRLDYRNTAGPGKLKGTRAMLSYAANVNEQLLLRGGAGAEVLDGNQQDTAIVELAAEGRLGDRLTGVLSYGRDVKRDNIASLARNIIAENFKVDLVLDMLPSVQAGGGLSQTSLSDSNATKGYDLWAAYLIFFEPAFLKLAYTYDFKDSDEGRKGLSAGPVLADGFSADDHPYWAPKNYWQNRFSVYFRHQLSDDQFRRGAPRYYDLEYAMTYDEKGYAMQTLKGGFFIEYSPMVILSATAELASGPDYRSRELFLSAAYRW